MPVLAHRRVRRTAVVALLVATALVTCRPAAAQLQSVETDVKAAFLYNFTRFVEWPAVPAGDRFNICVVGDRALAESLDSLIEGEEVHGRALARLEPRTAEEARTCQVLFVGARDNERGGQLLGAVRQLPVLTVGDPPHFLDQGGVIRFVVDANKVRFDINLAAATRARLKVSSKLLRVARSIEEPTR